MALYDSILPSNTCVITMYPSAMMTNRVIRNEYVWVEESACRTVNTPGGQRETVDVLMHL